MHRKSAYHVFTTAKWWPVEYLNDSWHYITWGDHAKEYYVAKEDQISQPVLVGLGTKTAPYVPREEQIRSDDDSPQIEEVPSEQRKEESDPDTPVATKQEIEDVENLSKRLEQTSVTVAPPFWTDLRLEEHDQAQATGHYPPVPTEEQLRQFEQNQLEQRLEEMATQTHLMFAGTQQQAVAGPSGQQQPPAHTRHQHATATSATATSATTSSTTPTNWWRTRRSTTGRPQEEEAAEAEDPTTRSVKDFDVLQD